MNKKLQYSSFGLLLFLFVANFLQAQIVCNSTPENDFCRDAIDVDGTLLGYTCCGEIEGFNLCGDLETGVWYRYDQNLSATFVEINNVSIEGGIGVEIYAGSCTSLTLLAQSDCTGFDNRNFTVPNCNGVIFIHVSTKNEGCGEFVISMTDLPGCEYANTCEDISPLLTADPIADGPQICISSCMDYSCESTCRDQSVWFQFNTDDFATTSRIEINNAGFEPAISVYRASNCSDLEDLIVCQAQPAGEYLDVSVAPNNLYYVEVHLDSGEASAFDICINTLQEYIKCSEGILTVSRPENPTANPDGPFCPGETVQFCYDMTFFVSTPGQGNNCQWLQGIVPILGGGWDLTQNSLDNQLPTNSGWFDDVHYNVESPVLTTANDPNGNLILEFGPGGLGSGDLLPGGWWYTNAGTQSGCSPNAEHPDLSWGLNAPCGSETVIQHCFNLTTRAVQSITDCDDAFSRDLSITIFNFADGETGCYEALACAGDTPVKFEGQIDCSTLVQYELVDDEICSGEFAEIPVTIAGSYEIPIIAEVIDAGNTTGANDWVFETGSGLIPDQIINNGNSIEVITYQVSFYEPESVCTSPVETFQVMVHPEFTIPAYAPVSICNGESIELTAPNGHDAYTWYDAETNEFIANQQNLTVDQAGFYRVEVVEDFCTAKEIVEVIVVDPLPVALNTTTINLCNEDDGTLPTAVDLNALLINNVSGEWFDESNQQVTDASNEDFLNATPGSYMYTYETDEAIFPCEDSTYVLEIVIDDCSCPEILLDPIADLCASNQTLDLSVFNLSGESGTWQIVSGQDVNSLEIQSDDLNINLNTVEGEYTIRFTLDAQDLGPLCETNQELTFSVFQEPFADIRPTGLACNEDTGTDPDFIDLDDYNLSNASGIWASSDPTAVIDSDNIVSFSGLEVKDYDFTFTFDNAQAPCVNPEYQVVITLEDCSCPSVALSPLMDFCAVEEDVDLTLIKLTTEEGTWSFTDGPDISSIIIENDILKLDENTVAGTYTLAFNLTNTDIGPDCDTQSTIEFNVNATPEATITPSGVACNEDTGTDPDFVDLDDYNESNSVGTWTSSNPNIQIDSDNIVSFAGLDVQDYTFTFETSTAITPCSDVQYETVITLNDCSCPSIAINPLDDQCIDNSTIDLNALKITSEPGTWNISDGPDVSSLNLVGNQLDINDGSVPGVYTIEFTITTTDIGPDCPLTSDFQFEIIQRPEAEITPQATACNEDNGAEPDFIDLDDLNINAVQGRWESLDPSITIDSDNIVSFAGADVQSYDFTFITETAVAPCPDVSYPVLVTVKDCSCPSIVVSGGDNLCQEDQMYNLNTLLVDAEPGSWTMLGGIGDIPTIQDEMLVVSESTSPGEYMLTYTLDDTNVPIDCETTIDIPININEQPEAEILTSAVVCNAFIGSLETNFDLDDLFVSGATGDWLSVDALVINTDNEVEFDGLMPGDYEFIYTTNTAEEPCQDIQLSAFITVEECVCPTLEVDPIGDLCAESLSIELTDILNASEPGMWGVSTSQSTMPEIFNQSQLLITQDMEAGIYTLNYTLDNMALPSLCNNMVSVDFNIFESPEAEIMETAIVCNVDDSPIAPDFIDLDDMFISGSSGTWSTSSSIGIATDNTIIFTGQPFGDYEFIYTTNTATDPCEEQAYQLVVSVQNCACPVLAFGSIPTMCNDESPLDLNSLLVSGVDNGFWAFVNGPDSPTIGMDETFDVIDLQEGNYTFRYELDEMVPNGCDQSAEITIVVNESPTLEVDPKVVVCNQSSSQAPNCIDLSTFVTGSNGSWVAPPSFTGNFNNIANVCFDGMTVGSKFLFSYTTNTAEAPCIDKTGSIEVEVIDCSCPNLSLNDPADLCSTGDFINLSDLEFNSTVNGSWSFLGGPETYNLSNTEIFDATDLTAGTYSFQFTPTDTPEQMCPQTNEINIEVVTPPNAGIGNTVDYCEDDEQMIPLFALLDDADDGGIWTEISDVASVGQSFNAIAGTFDMIGQIPGTYEFQYEHVGFEPCPEAVAIVTVIILENPTADAGEDQIITCANDEIVLGGPDMSDGPRIIYSWTEESGLPIDNADSANPTIFQAGIYNVVVTDIVFGCQTEDQIIINEDIGFPTFDAEVLPFDCENGGGGSVVVFNSIGGNGDYLYSIDGGNSWTENAQFDNLQPGVYSVILQDGNGCEATVNGLEIFGQINIELDLGDDVEITYGENYYPLQVQTAAQPSDLDSVIWTMDGEIICEGDYDSCSIIEVDPEGVNTFCVRVVDVNGCEETDCVVIRERLDVNVYIANVFTPEINDFNNRFFVQSDENIKYVKSFRVFDRWGSQIFEGAPEHETNIPSFGWDGTWKNKDVKPGVFTYHVVVEDVLGSSHDFAGSVTLLR